MFCFAGQCWAQRTIGSLFHSGKEGKGTRSMKFSFNLLPITLLVLSIIGQNADPHQLPDSQTGKRVAAYITAFNSHDDKIFGGYLSDNLSQKSLAGRSMEDRFKCTTKCMTTLAV